MSGWRWPAAVVAAYVAILLLVRPDTYIDSFNYAKHILDHAQGALPPAQDPFFDFGHALWRPMGYAVFQIFGSALTAFFDGNRMFAAAASLIVWNVAAGLVGTLLLYFLCLRLSRSAAASAAAAIGFAVTHASMNFATTGNAYMAGLACQIGALYLLDSSLRNPESPRARSLGAGVLLGVSVGIWFPFVLSVPGLLCFALLWKRDVDLPLGTRFTRVAEAVAASAVVLVAVYAAVMAGREIATVAEARAWMAASRYEIAPTRGLARMAFAIPRSFFLMGNDNTIWKQALLGTGSVRMSEVVNAAWKLVSVYLLLGGVAYLLFRQDWGRRLLLCLAAVAVPVGFFAAFLFDPSPPERYMPLFPLLFTAVACLLASEGTGRLARTLLLGFLGLMLGANGFAMSRFQSDTALQLVIDRLESVNLQAGDRDLIVVPTYLDEAFRFIDARPFHPASRLRLNLYVGLPLGTDRVLRWDKYLSEQILETWAQGGRVWIASRFLREKPEAPWWVEGDESRMQWQAVPRFFRTLEIAPAAVPDGFGELLPGPGNEQQLRLVVNQ